MARQNKLKSILESLLGRSVIRSCEKREDRYRRKMKKVWRLADMISRYCREDVFPTESEFLERVLKLHSPEEKCDIKIFTVGELGCVRYRDIPAALRRRSCHLNFWAAVKWIKANVSKLETCDDRSGYWVLDVFGSFDDPIGFSKDGYLVPTLSCYGGIQNILNQEGDSWSRGCDLVVAVRNKGRSRR